MNELEDKQLPDRDHLYTQLDRHIDWIKSCDTKASIVLAVVGIFVSFFTTEHFFNVFARIVPESISSIKITNFIYTLILLISLVIFLTGVYFLVKVLIPRLSNQTKLAEDLDVSNSLYFFESISDNRFKEFKEKVYSQSKEDEIEDLIAQIYINASISTIKYQNYDKGIKRTSIGITMIIILLIIGVFL